MTDPPQAATVGASLGEKINYVKERELNSPALVRKSREERVKKGFKVDVKLASAFVKKVATLTDETAPGIVRDVHEKLNLSKFVEEVVASLSKAPLKLKDIDGAVLLSSAMHRSYDEFAGPLIKALSDQFDLACKSDDKADIARRRVLLRFLAELYMVGLVEFDPQLLLKIVRAVTRAGCPQGALPEILPETLPPLPDQACMNLQAVTSLIKSLGLELLGSDAIFPPAGIRTKLASLFRAYTLGLLSRLHEERIALRRLRRRIDNDSLKRGEVSSEASDALERREKTCEELYLGAIILCECLGLTKPPSPEELREEEDAKREAEDQAIAEKVGLELLNRRKGGEADLSFEAWVFGDDATRSFYEDLHDLVLVIPRSILERPDQALQPSLVERLKGEAAPEPAISQGPEAPANEEQVYDDGDTTNNDEINNPDAIQVDDDDDEEETKANGETAEVGEHKKLVSKVENVTRPVEELMNRLPEMVTERQVDAFARDFAHYNSKSARRRLVEELFDVPRGRLELLPFYARLAATLSRVYSGIGRALVDSVRNGFFKCTRDHRPNSRMISRVLYAKYLSELVKFGLKCPTLECPPAAAFRALRQTFDFFQGGNVDMACMLVEGCGRELYRTPRTHSEIAKLLESLQRNRTVRNLGPVLDALVDNAYYHCIPADSSVTAKKARRERTELEQYVRYLLIERLGRNTIDVELKKPSLGENEGRERLAHPSKDKKNIKASKMEHLALSEDEVAITESLLRLPWNSSYDECEEAISRSVIAACKHRAGNLPMVSTVVSLLCKRYLRLGIRVVEDLLEAVLVGLDENDFRHNQRRIGQVRMFAHMFKSGLVLADLFFDVLFLILHIGHEKPLNVLQAQMIVSAVASGPDVAASTCCFANASRFHPGVPCSKDPPWDSFRIRLVCSALEVAAEKVLSPTAVLGRLELLVLYLERYVWNKNYVPIETEFQMLDVLHELEVKMAAEQASIASQGKKAVASKRKKSKSAPSPATSQASICLVGRAPTRQAAEDQIAALEGAGFQSELKVSDTIAEGDEEEDDDEDHEEEEETEDDSHGEGEEDEDVDDGDEEAEDGDEDDSFSARVPQPPPVLLRPKQPSADDLAFDQEFAKMMKETLEQSGKSNLSGQALRGDNLAIPLGVMRKTNSTSNNNSGNKPQIALPTPKGGVSLSLLKRGPNKKVEVRNLVVPDDSLLAKASLDQEVTRREMREEEQAIKRLTLKAAQATSTRMRDAPDL